MKKELIEYLSGVTGLPNETVEDYLLRLHEIFHCAFSSFHSDNYRVRKVNVFYSEDRLEDFAVELVRVINRFRSHKLDVKCSELTPRSYVIQFVVAK